ASACAVSVLDRCDQTGPAPTAARTSTADRGAVVTWNTHVGAGDVDDLLTGVRAGEFSEGRRIDHVVLLLQESYRSGDGVPARVADRAGVPGRIARGSHATHARDIGRVAAAQSMAVLYAPSMRNGAAADDPEDRGN